MSSRAQDIARGPARYFGGAVEVGTLTGKPKGYPPENAETPGRWQFKFHWAKHSSGKWMGLQRSPPELDSEIIGEIPSVNIPKNNVIVPKTFFFGLKFPFGEVHVTLRQSVCVSQLLNSLFRPSVEDFFCGYPLGKPGIQVEGTVGGRSNNAGLCCFHKFSFGYGWLSKVLAHINEVTSVNLTRPPPLYGILPLTKPQQTTATASRDSEFTDLEIKVLGICWRTGAQQRPDPTDHAHKSLAELSERGSNAETITCVNTKVVCFDWNKSALSSSPSSPLLVSRGLPDASTQATRYRLKRYKASAPAPAVVRSSLRAQFFPHIVTFYTLNVLNTDRSDVLLGTHARLSATLQRRIKIEVLACARGLPSQVEVTPPSLPPAPTMCPLFAVFTPPLPSACRLPMVFLLGLGDVARAVSRLLAAERALCTLPPVRDLPAIKLSADVPKMRAHYVAVVPIFRHREGAGTDPAHGLPPLAFCFGLPELGPAPARARARGRIT
ncbi:hypothetical protein GGX14DRAFT_401579 [Mycena pura]|uniref:Uncharacterized protein n=1 Tax=Mycena pura TaxID=153505 RepID=A0AAD6V410_9AGAR|nr:hypothetical protein GGX14DRAFT_401579 [Mycena pura]